MSSFKWPSTGGGIAPGTYLPLTGGTLTGRLSFPSDVSISLAGNTITTDSSQNDSLVIDGSANLSPVLILGGLSVTGGLASDGFTTGGTLLAVSVVTTTLSIGNSTSAVAPVSAANKFEVFDASGNSLGFVYTYSS